MNKLLIKCTKKQDNIPSSILDTMNRIKIVYKQVLRYYCYPNPPIQEAPDSFERV